MRGAQYNQALRDSRRFEKLAAEGVVSVHEAELYAENTDAKYNAMKMASDTVNLLENGMRPEQIAAAKANVKEPRQRLCVRGHLLATRNSALLRQV